MILQSVKQRVSDFPENLAWNWMELQDPTGRHSTFEQALRTPPKYRPVLTPCIIFVPYSQDLEMLVAQYMRPGAGVKHAKINTRADGSGDFNENVAELSPPCGKDTNFERISGSHFFLLGLAHTWCKCLA